MFHRGKICMACSVFLVTSIFVAYVYLESELFLNKNVAFHSVKYEHGNNAEVFIAVVACGEKLEETLTMIKSALVFNKAKLLNFKIITQDSLKDDFEEELTKWQRLLAVRFYYKIYSLKFPKAAEHTWRMLFKPCAAQRLFLPSLLDDVDSAIYVDTDILFLSPPEETWKHFHYFSDAHIAGLSPEHEDVNIGWYSRFARHPFFGEQGVNSGVMLMNFTRMRNFNWEKKFSPLYKRYKSYITWGDQDLINILFHFHPDKLYILPCTYNYRPDHCMYMNICNVSDGIRILHGNRNYFHLNKQPLFTQIYLVFKDFTMEDPSSIFSDLIKQAIQKPNIKNSSCGQIISRGYLSNI